VPGRRDATVALARMLLARGERDEARALLAGAPGDFQAEGLDARMRLQDSGALEDAFAALDDGDVRGGLELLLAALGDGDGTGEDIRRVIVGELDALGPESELAREARRRLATSLY
jgi:putative thioredoxin